MINDENINIKDAEKRERIINAAMKEFLKGYKAASTDEIVRNAGISKGMLFHLFGSKENLYKYLVSHAVETVRAEVLEAINVKQTDILEIIWQMALLKQDVSQKYPDMFDFLTAAYINMSESGANEDLLAMAAMREQIIGTAYMNADKSLLRDDIDNETAINIINWAVDGYAMSKRQAVAGNNPGATTRENYEAYLQEFDRVIKILKKCFYKEGAS